MFFRHRFLHRFLIAFFNGFWIPKWHPKTLCCAPPWGRTSFSRPFSRHRLLDACWSLLRDAFYMQRCTFHLSKWLQKKLNVSTFGTLEEVKSTALHVKWSLGGHLWACNEVPVGTLWAPFWSLWVPFWLHFRSLGALLVKKSSFWAPDLANHLQIAACNSERSVNFRLHLYFPGPGAEPCRRQLRSAPGPKAPRAC